MMMIMSIRGGVVGGRVIVRAATRPPLDEMIEGIGMIKKGKRRGKEREKLNWRSNSILWRE
jgi:hypothetical protein